MKNVFFLNLLSPGDLKSAVVSWILLGDASSDEGSSGALQVGSLSDFSSFVKQADDKKSSAKAKKTNHCIVAVLPGQHVTYARLALPTHNKKKILQAIPFAVEEFVIGDIDEMSIIVGDFNPDGSVRVAVVKKTLLNNWTSLFSEAELDVDYLVGQPDLLALEAPDTAQILIRDNLLLFKSVEHCYQFDGDNLTTVIELMPFPASKKIKLYFDSAGKSAGKIARQYKMEMEADGEIAVELIDFSGNIFDTIDFDPRKPQGRINLLSNSAMGDIESLSNPQAWLPMAYVLACLAAVFIALNFGYAYYFHKKAESMIANAEAHYQKLFPDEKLNDLKPQWAARLGRLTENSVNRNFSHVFPLVVSGFSDGKSGKTPFSVDKFKYDSESGELRVDIDLKSIAVLESVKASLKQKGYELEIVSANEEKDLVRASILVKAL